MSRLPILTSIAFYCGGILVKADEKAPSSASVPTSLVAAPTSPPPKPTEKVLASMRFIDLFRPFRTENAALSPDGKYVAYSIRENEDLSVIVIEIDKPTAAIAKVTVASDTTSTAMLTNAHEKTAAAIRWMRWVNPTRIVVETNQNFVEQATGDWSNTSGAVLAFDFDGKNSRFLITPEDVRKYLPDSTLGPATPKPASANRTPGPDEPVTSQRENDFTSTQADPFSPQVDDPTVAAVAAPALSARSIRVFSLSLNDPNSVLVRTADLQAYDVFKVDVHSAKLSRVAAESVSPDDLPLVDRQGRARLIIPASTKTSFPHRFALEKRSGLSRWTNLDKIAGFSGSGFSLSPDNFMGERAIPVGFDEDPNILYFASNVGRNTFGIYSLDLKTGRHGSLTIENPNFDLIQPSKQEYPDPGTLVYDRFTGKLAGVRFEARLRTATWLKPEIESVQLGLEANFKGRSVEVMEWDSSFKRFLVLVRGPADPGAYYIFDREKGSLSEFVHRAPWLDTKESHLTLDYALENPKGGGTISGIITLPKAVRTRPIPVIVLCANEPWQRTRSEFRTDVHALADMGFAVVQVNGRGAWGFGLKQREAIKTGFDKDQVEDIGNALDFLMKKFPILNPKRIAVMGEDRGGYLALRALQLDPHRFRCAVAINPTVDLAGWIAEARWTSGSTGPVLTKAFYGDADRIAEAPLKDHPETVTQPICILSYPGPEGEARSFTYLAARLFSSRVKSKDVPVEFYDLNEDYTRRLPTARAHALSQIEDFLNSYIYAYKVDVKEAVPVKD